MTELESLLVRYPRWVALTGAGISAGSGIPTYRNDRGEWQRSDPIQHQDFLTQEASRRRYWARSMAGWTYVAASKPNLAHIALARLEATGHITLLATQNVDRLHQAAGHQRVVDLHGRLDRVCCLNCNATLSRAALQQELAELNAGWHQTIIDIRPDGDAEVDDAIVDSMQVPPCKACGGTLMPDVVFFGGTVPKPRVEAITTAINEADALLVAGSSLTVFSGFRFVRMAHKAGKPVIIVNRGHTRGDDLATLKIEADAGPVLDQLANSAGSASASVG
ncbi:MAG: NAD-dependent protein deacetylase [Pseudomonadota bacterium]